MKYSILILVAVLSGCASQRGPQAARGQVHRYLAWVEGEFQNNYETDRSVANSKLAAWQEKAPDPSDTEDYLEYLSLLDAAGKSSEAEVKLKKYLSDHPTESRAAFILGVHYLRAKKRELASYFFTQLESKKDFPWASLLYNNLGMLALQDKSRDQALMYFEKAVKASPPSAAPLVNLGSLYLQSRSYADAKSLFEKAVNIDPQFEDAALGLGIALEGLGKFDEARQAYASFTEGNPGSTSVLFNYAIVLGNRLKRRDEAAQVMLRYVQRGGKESAKAHEIIQSWR